MNAAAATGQRLLGVTDDGCWVGGLGGDLGKYMNGAVCLGLCVGGSSCCRPEQHKCSF